MFVCTKNTVCISYNYIDTRYALATWRSRNNIAIAMYGATTTGWLRYRYIQRKKKYLCIQSWEQNETHIRHLILYLCKYKLLLLFCFFCFTGSSISINTREEINNKKKRNASIPWVSAPMLYTWKIRSCMNLRCSFLWLTFITINNVPSSPSIPKAINGRFLASFCFKVSYMNEIPMFNNICFQIKTFLIFPKICVSMLHTKYWIEIFQQFIY